MKKAQENSKALYDPTHNLSVGKEQLILKSNFSFKNLNNQSENNILNLQSAALEAAANAIVLLIPKEQ